MKKTLLPFLLLILPLSIEAVDAPKRGLEIAEESARRNSGWTDQQAKILMTLRNRHGDESVRENRIKTLEVNGDGDKSLIVFDTPPDVKGTAFLSHTHPEKADDQWLFLPALKRVKRVSSANKSGPFMGSEFAYEDISSQEVDKYQYTYLRDEETNGYHTHVIERLPNYEHSGYKKQVVWIDTMMYQPVKIEFYDRKGELLKTLHYFDYAQYLNKYWRPTRMEMENHQTGKSTTLSWLDYRFKSGLKPRDFDQNSLKRIH